MDKGPPQLTVESDFPPLICPRCEIEFTQEPWPEYCPDCGKRIDLKAQFAYCRGVDAFSDGQDLLYRIYRRRMKSRHVSAQEREGLRSYTQAYTALQSAFKGELSRSQRELGVEMMAAIAKIFQINLMISPIEEAYWTTLLVQRNSHQELDEINQKLASDKKKGIFGIPFRWRWNSRKNALEKGLLEIEEKLKVMEKNIGFVDSFRTHPKNG